MSSNSHANHFEFITGFRGLCTLWVVVANSNWKQDIKTSEVLLFVGYTKQTFAVNCLFLLNAFLLTYRLATDLNQSNLKYSVSMFLMRRTIRIYFAYVLFCTLIKCGPKLLGGNYNYDSHYSYNSWWQLVTLTATGHNHLWPIPAGIFSIFMISIVSLAYQSIKLKHVLLIALLLIIHLNICENIYDFPKNAISPVLNLPEQFSFYAFKFSLSVVLQGATLALLFKFFEEGYLKYIEIYLRSHKKMKSAYKMFINISTLLMISFAFDSSKLIWEYANEKTSFNYLVLPAYLWSMVLWLMLISTKNENIFKDILEHNLVLKWLGKYSLGIYLWHPMCIQLKEDTSFITIITQFIDRYVYIAVLSTLIGFLFIHSIKDVRIRLEDNFYIFLKIKLSSNIDGYINAASRC